MVYGSSLENCRCESIRWFESYPLRYNRYKLPMSKMDKEEVQAMIDQSVAKAIDNHNKTATIISASIGSVLLFFYAHGLLTVVDKVK